MYYKPNVIFKLTKEMLTAVYNNKVYPTDAICFMINIM